MDEEEEAHLKADVAIVLGYTLQKDGSVSTVLRDRYCQACYHVSGPDRPFHDAGCGGEQNY